ncbi:hypothetical protein JX265_002960 [Neoarthrinium moseri]|uniref:Small secreted protein n=1 Tax=Neoarthrinium moseri TaxID=1658444 RepID=A0A9Q0APS9_9PEZI|nr:hypothetical protein JX265_002960 [Neoarthrinium moseri]
MKLTASVLPMLLSAPALSAPVSMAADASWTLVAVTRTCNPGDTTCFWQFSIETGAPGATPCPYTVNATASAPASQANGGPTACGNFTVTSGWSGQFGPGEGFTTFSVIDRASKLIAYPAYTDKELVNGTAVSPDRSYPVQTLPS